MNLTPPAPPQDVSLFASRRRWLVLLAVAIAAFAAIRAANRRAEAARARAERHQVQRAHEEISRIPARKQEAAAPIRSGPVWIESREAPLPASNSRAGDSAPRPIERISHLESSQPVSQPGSLFAMGTTAVLSANTVAPADKPQKNRGEDLFESCVVPKLVIEVPRAGVAALGDNPRQYVVVKVREGAIVYTNVALKLKGGPGSFRNFEDRPSLTLNFGKFAEGQSFHGLKKIHLNSSIQDGSFLCEKLGRELFLAAGVPTPRAGHAIVTLNGRELGLHVLLEGVNRQFLKRHFKDPGGNVYNGRFGLDVSKRIPVNEGENPRDLTRLKALNAAATEPDLDERRKQLEAVLDVDRFLTFVALEVILAHWDGYTMNRNNFRIFHDRSTDRMVFFPHGMDQLLGRRDIALMPKSQAIVVRGVLEVPDFRARYRSRLAELTTNTFQPVKISDRVREIVARVEPVIAAENEEAATAFRRRSRSFEKRVLERSATLERALFGARQLAGRKTNGVPQLMEWRPRLDLGDATLERVRDERGRAVLRIRASEGCTASWRSRAILEPGRYRLEGEMRTQGVEFDTADPRSGAGFRISRQRVGQKNPGNHEWSAVRHEFNVGEKEPDVELICELRAKKGVLWLDPESVKLTRLDP